MTNWAYIATPFAANLSFTTGLARGTLPGMNGDVGLIHRRLHDDDGNVIDAVTKVQSGDTILLMYDLYHTGLIYPIWSFQVQDNADREICLNKDKIILKKSNKQCELVRICCANQLLETDYLGNKDKIDKCHYGFVVKELSGQFSASYARKVFLRKSTDKAVHALERIDDLEIKDERDALWMLDALVDVNGLSESIRSSCKKYLDKWTCFDGRIKQLLVNSVMCEEQLSRTKIIDYSPIVFPLCALFENVVNRLLSQITFRLIEEYSFGIYENAEKNMAKKNMNDNKSKRKHKGWTALPVCPEDCDVLDMNDKIMILQRHSASPIKGCDKNLFDAFHTARKIRNRTSHAYFIEKGHYEELCRSIRILLDAYFRIADI